MNAVYLAREVGYKISVTSDQAFWLWHQLVSPCRSMSVIWSLAARMRWWHRCLLVSSRLLVWPFPGAREGQSSPHGRHEGVPSRGRSLESQMGKCQACRPSKCKYLTALEFSSPGGEKKALIYEVKCHNTLQHITSQHAATWSWHLFALISQNSFYLEQMLPVNSNSSHFLVHCTCQFLWGQLFLWSVACADELSGLFRGFSYFSY